MNTILVFLVLLSVLVLVHELGHFVAAKLAGIRVEEFGIGFPPRALRLFRHKETEYTINWLPIGGFVKLYGEEPVEDARLESSASKTKSGAFYAQSNLVKSLVLTAGVAMNYLLGLVLIMVVFARVGQPQVNNVLEIQRVVAHSPAAEAGLEAGDLVTRIANKSITSPEEVVELINRNKGKEITLVVKKGSIGLEQSKPDVSTQTERMVRLVPRQSPPPGEGAIGIAFVVVPQVKYLQVKWVQVPWLALQESVRLVKIMFVGVGQILRDLFRHGVIPKDITGPVGIARITGQVAKQGFYQLLQFAALLSINLAVINILPFPALDGGRLIFVLAEAAAGRKLAPKVQRWANIAGMLLLLGLMVLITIYDVVRIF